MNIRPSPIAGTWYPGVSETLKQIVRNYIDQADVSGYKQKPIALISPHAGYKYSGNTAGHAFKLVDGNSFDVVVVISPYHSQHPDNILISNYDAYSTPLGNIPIDRKLVDQLNSYLENSIGKTSASIIQEQEHSLEIILPFLQVALLNDFKLLPIMLSGHSYKSAEAIGEFIANLATNKKILMVASTDLSHFHNLKDANKLDTNLLIQFSSMSIETILKTIKTGRGEACGIMAVIAILTACNILKAKELNILNYTTSAEVTGDKNSVVGYASAVIS